MMDKLDLTEFKKWQLQRLCGLQTKQQYIVNKDEWNRQKPGKNPRRERVVFTPEMDKIFIELYNTHDRGRFKKLCNDNNTGNNMVKSDAWNSFTAAFNEVGYLLPVPYKIPVISSCRNLVSTVPEPNLYRYSLRIQVAYKYSASSHVLQNSNHITGTCTFISTVPLLGTSTRLIL